MLLSDLEKSVYNKYLKALAKANDKPFIEKKEFVNLNDEKIDCIKKLTEFLISHKNINFDIFFSAPYKVFSDKKFYSLDYFYSQSSLKSYFLYLNFLNIESPDCEENLEFIMESIVFIKNFCLSKNLDFIDYLNYTDSVTLDWCRHVFCKKISIYNILAFSYFDINIYVLINKIPSDERELLLGDYGESISEYMDKLNNSNKAKFLLIKGYRKVEEVLKNNLKK
jgi:hypothetical protein